MIHHAPFCVCKDPFAYTNHKLFLGGFRSTGGLSPPAPLSQSSNLFGHPTSPTRRVSDRWRTWTALVRHRRSRVPVWLGRRGSDGKQDAVLGLPGRVLERDVDDDV